MPIVIDYGNIGPALAAAQKAGFVQQQNENAKLQLQAANIQNDYAAAMAAAASRVIAQEQESRDQANALSARSFMNAQDVQARYDLAEYDHYNQMGRDAYLANMQGARDERLFQQKLAYDRENDARTFQQQREQLMISRGIPLTPNEAMELNQLERGMASLDSQLADGTLHPTEHQQMVQRIAPRRNYLDTRRISAEERQRTEMERNANRARNFTIGHFPDPNSPPVLDENGRPQIIPEGEFGAGMVRRQNTILVQSDNNGHIQPMHASLQQQRPRPISPIQLQERINQQMRTLRTEMLDARRLYDQTVSETERAAMSPYPEWWNSGATTTRQQIGPVTLPFEGNVSVGRGAETTNDRMMREAIRRVRVQLEAANEYIAGPQGGGGRGGLGENRGQAETQAAPTRSQIDQILSGAAATPARQTPQAPAGNQPPQQPAPPPIDQYEWMQRNPTRFRYPWER